MTSAAELVMRVVRSAGLLLAVVVAAACSAPEPELGVRFEGKTMGTTFVVRVDDPLPEEGREAVAALVRETLDDVDAHMSTYRPDSEVSRLNALATDAPFALSDETFIVLQTAMQIAEISGGAFDPTVGALVNAWGFGPADNPAAEPSAAELAMLAEHTGYHKLELDVEASAAIKRDPLLQIDLSAIAKGYAVDRVVATLLQAGFTNLMVEVGGEVRTTGHTAAGKPWRIGIERPDTRTEEIQRMVPLTDLAIASSGNYRNFYVLGGRVVGHTIDPRTARPVDHEGASVSVIAEECMWADGWATALMVMGPEEGMRWAEERGLAALYVVHEGDGAFAERTTPDFSRIAGMPLQ